ncbi:MAG: PaaI family thioesterase [Candidatus Omnitrophica bacterium]|nr:PaaI family thioesterase [Candidatus Omnitrophota bacterium]
MEIIKKPKAPFEKYLRIKIIKAKDGYAKLKMPYRKELTNPHGSIHGGAIASLGDTAMAVAISSKYLHSSFYTVKLEVKFKAPVNKGEIFAEADIVNKRGKFIFGRVEIKDNEDKLLAQALATFYLASK